MPGSRMIPEYKAIVYKIRHSQLTPVRYSAFTTQCPNENCLFRRYLCWAQILILEIF